MEDKNIGNWQKHPDISREKFTSFCTELKLLYVAITRTKQDLFMFDEDEAVSV